MTLYERRPSDEVLVRFAWTRYPDVRTIRLCSDDGETYTDHEHADTMRGGPKMNLTRGTVWALMCADQALWQQTHPTAEATFA